jgi:hypothetical protein
MRLNEFRRSPGTGALVLNICSKEVESNRSHVTVLLCGGCVQILEVPLLVGLSTIRAFKNG